MHQVVNHRLKPLFKMLADSVVLLAIVLLQSAAREPPAAEAWQRAAEMLHNAMDESANPCDDFYTFACGNWPKLNPIPPREYEYDAETKLRNKVYGNVVELLDNFDPRKHPEAVRKAKVYYDACTGKTGQGEDLKYIVERLNEFGKWPMISEDWSGPVGGPWKNASALNGKIMGTISEARTLISISDFVVRDKENRPEVYLELAPRALYHSPPTTQQIIDEVSSVARKLADASGTVLDEAILHQDATDLAVLEVKLYELLNKKRVESRTPFHLFNVSSATVRWPFFDWRAMLSAAAVGNVPRKLILTSPLSFPTLAKLDNLGPLIKTIPNRLMQNLLLWRFVRDEMSFIPRHSDDFEERRERSRKTNTGYDGILCARFLMLYMPSAVGRLYVDQWFGHHAPKTRSTLQDMLSFVSTAFKGNVHGLDWMDEKSKMGAYRKADNMVHSLGYNDWIMEDIALNERYSALNISVHDDKFKVNEQISRLKVWEDFQKLVKPRDRTDMLDSPADVFARYLSRYNSMSFSAGIINEPIFISNGPMTVNYGAMGSRMGHVLTHGFDNYNIEFGPFGGYNKTEWMTEKSMEGFNKMAKCLVDQYDHFCFKQIGKCVNGTLTESENIADNGGLFAAYSAFKSWNDLSGGEPRLPEPMSKYSKEQIFFLSYARPCCGNMTDEALDSALKYRIPNHARVTQTLRNVPQFAEAFNCKAGSGMAPKKRCNVWVKPHI